MAGNMLLENTVMVERSSGNPNSQWMQLWSWGWELNLQQAVVIANSRFFAATFSFFLNTGRN